MSNPANDPNLTILSSQIPYEILLTLLRTNLQKAIGPLNTYSTTDDPGSDVFANDKRTLKDINDSIDWDLEYTRRESFVKEELVKYGVPNPDSNVIISKPTTHEQPMIDVFKLSVLETMKASIRNKPSSNDEDIGITDDSLELLSDFTSQFIRLISERLKRLTEIQRRKIPNKDDMEILLREGYFDVSGLSEMYELSKSSTINKENLQNIQKKALVSVSAYNGTDDGGFNNISEDYDGVQTQDSWWIDQYIRRKKRRSYIPDWMPPLPPDYTFKSTPKYNNRITNPVIIREKSVNEGRLGEKALNNIMKREDRSLKIEFNESSSEDDEEEKEDEEVETGLIEEIDKENSNQNVVKTLDNPNKGEDAKPGEVGKKQPLTEQSANSENKFDLVAMANNRMKLLEKRRKEEEERINKRVNSDESHFGKLFGFYSNLKKLPDGVNDELNEYRNKKLYSLVKNLEKQEKWNAQWLLEQEEKRKTIAAEKSEYAEANEIQIGLMGDNNNDNAFNNIDEEVEFDIEFSDMEDFKDSNAEDQINSNEPVMEDKGPTVRFEDKVTSMDADEIIEDSTKNVIASVSNTEDKLDSPGNFNSGSNHDLESTPDFTPVNTDQKLETPSEALEVETISDDKETSFFTARETTGEPVVQPTPETTAGVVLQPIAELDVDLAAVEEMDEADIDMDMFED